ncbi:MAG: fibronectin type III domain-containing protein [Candidatus Azambacteria bacterium]|nr:fibronectin type III domain-containing protein [Candidatus Azambacteria bacterium]
MYSLVPPTVSFSAAPSTINLGDSATLTWSSANAISCTASGGWSGGKAVSGSEVVTPTTTTTYTLACTGASTTTSPPVTVTVIIPDTIRPSNPTGLSAAAVSSSQINLTWTPSTDNVAVVGYRVERCMGVACGGTDFAWIANAGAIASFSNFGLNPSTSYTYRVRAYDAVGLESVQYSNAATDVTQVAVDSTQPTPAPILTYSSASSAQVDLSWTASNDPESGISGYRVYRASLLPFASMPFLMATVTGTTYSDTVTLTPGVTFRYYVLAVNGQGLSTQSNNLDILIPPPPDIMPPTFIFTSPAALLPVDTTSTTLAGTTDEPATCRYSTTSGPYSSMTLFSSDLGAPGTNHSQLLTGLTNGASYIYYVKCRDTAPLPNTNITDVVHMFQVDSPGPDLAAPVIVSSSPASAPPLPASTTSVTMSVTTNENADCRYSTNSATPFLTMTDNFLGSGTGHTVVLPVSSGTSYLYYVRCQDTPAGNPMTSSYPLSFSVAFPTNAMPIAVINVVPTTGTAPLTVSASGAGSTDTDGVIIEYRWSWGDFSPDTFGASASHTYTTNGTHIVSLRVRDNQGGFDVKSRTIVVSPIAPEPIPEPLPSICTAACATDADCAPNVCGPAKFCVAQGTGLGPERFNGYFSRTDGTLSQPGEPLPAIFPAGTTALQMSVVTDVNANCQYSEVSGTPYGASAMRTFSQTNGAAHQVTLTGLGSTTAVTRTYYIRCKDNTSGIINDVDYIISATLNAPTVVSGPNPYTCLINSNFVRNNIPYVFDICIPK